MPLSLPIELDSVNCYLVIGSDGVTVIDPGWAWDEGEAPLRRALGAYGAELGDVRRVLATHQHWDHYSLACHWRRDYGTHVALGDEERHSIAGHSPDDPPFLRQSELLRGAGASELADRLGMLVRPDYETAVVITDPDHWIHDGERFDLGGTTLRAVATPGHTRGHMVFIDDAAGVALTGDHILPRITPSIAYETVPDPLALVRFLESLRIFVDTPDLTMLPAHGLPHPSTATRAAELINHHDERLVEILSLLDDGHTTAYAIARAMSWTRRATRFVDLGLVHGMTAVLEVGAHLRYLEHRANVVSEVHHGVEHFVRT